MQNQSLSILLKYLIVECFGFLSLFITKLDSFEVIVLDCRIYIVYFIIKDSTGSVYISAFLIVLIFSFVMVSFGNEFEEIKNLFKSLIFLLIVLNICINI